MTLIERQASLVEIETNQAARKAQDDHFFQTEEKDRKQQLLSILDKVSPAHVEVDQENAAANWVKGRSFGLWLLENVKVKAWLDSTDNAANLLWMKGIPGAGESRRNERRPALSNT